MLSYPGAPWRSPRTSDKRQHVTCTSQGLDAVTVSVSILARVDDDYKVVNDEF